MQIGLKAPVSLSMRMRTESATVPPPGPGSLSSTSGQQRGTKELPGLPRLTGAGVGGGSTSSLGTASSPGRGGGGGGVPAAASFRYPFERLSGSIDFVASSGVFADRSVVVNPAAVCVRCAEHASVCMSCTEILCQEGLNFYRKTRARGAASLFANAITQTGITTVVKSAVFKLWSNGLQYRKRREKKMTFVCEKAFRVTLMGAPFRAWRSFVKAEIIEKKNKAIEELEGRAAFLEQQVLKATAERSAFEQQAKFVSSMLKDRDKTIAEQAALIEEQTAALAMARRRITGLASLTPPVIALKGVASQLTEQGAEDTRGRLLRGAATIGAAHDYSKVFDADTYRGLAKDKARRMAGKAITKLDETTEVIEMLLNWATCKSRDANSATDAKGATLQDSLPKFRVIESIDDLVSAQHILRVVVAVIFESTQEGKTTLRLPSMVEFLHAQRGGAEAAPLTAASLSLSDELVADIKSPAQSAGDMAAKAVRLAVKWLHLPAFSPKDITSGNNPVILALLGHLMLADAVPAQHSSQVQRVGELIRAFESADADVKQAQRALGAGGLEAVAERWEELVGLREVKAPEPAAAPAAPAAPAAAAATEGGSDASGGTNDPPSDPSTTPDTDTDTNTNAQAQAPAEPPAAPTDSPEARYERLLAAVDSYLDALGDPTKPDEAGRAGGRLRSQVGQLGDAVEGAAAVRAEVGAVEAGREAGVRLATEVRAAVTAAQLEMVLGELKWASR